MRHSNAGFSLIELLIVVVIIGLLSAVAFPLYTDYLQSSRQKAAMQQMRALADANELLYAEQSAYAGELEDLVEAGKIGAIRADPWGNPYAYEVTGRTFRITSYGLDGVAGPQPPEGWVDEPYEADIIYEGGVFRQAPGVE